MRCVLLAMMSCAAVSLLCGTTQAAPATQASVDGARPEVLAVTVGDILTRIDGPKLWTLSGIEYQKTVMAMEDSAYGAVLTIRGVGHLGTAHFLDVPGKPGEVEKENVTDLRLLLDGQSIAITAPKMNVEGKSFRMERKSKIRSMDVDSTVDIRDGVLMETIRFRTATPIDLNAAHLLMYAWTPQATKYLLGDDSGIQKRGTFLSAPAETARTVEKSSRWVAVFEPVSGKGAVCVVLKHPADADAWLLFVDAPGVYRKVAVESLVEKIVPAGFDGTYQSAVGCFSATDKDWEKLAQQRVNELKLHAAKLER